ncbi:MAG: LuxR C-terminal-related transcriptional regulator [Pirellulaceae bacterium]|nr:LuxR C-terminal-related transcriptional regulator [Pirellulaceae bacterium]
MKEPARRFFELRKLCVCVKDQEKRVVYQNKACLNLCGDMSSLSCDKNCMRCYHFNNEAPDREEGTQYYPNEFIEGEYYDILFVNDGENVTTFLYPLKGRQEADVRHISEYDLTKREQEIIRMVIEGHTNTVIAKKLYVSKATVKKHLNNIYKKLPADLFPR